MTSPGAASTSSLAARRLLTRGLIIVVALVLAWFFRDPPRADHDPLGTPAPAAKGPTARAPDDRRPITPTFADEPTADAEDRELASRNGGGEQDSESRRDSQAGVDESPLARTPQQTPPATSKSPPKVPAARPPVISSGVPPPKAEQDDAKKIVVRDVTIRDQSNRVIYMGDVDLTPTLEKIKKGVRNEHRNNE